MITISSVNSINFSYHDVYEIHKLNFFLSVNEIFFIIIDIWIIMSLVLFLVTLWLYHIFN